MGRARWLAVVAGCLVLAGCANMNPRNWHWPTSHPKKARAGGDDRIPPPDPPPATPEARRPGPAEATGMLAGQVTDGLNQRRGGTLILVTTADAGPADAPKEVIADNQGYFVVQGLEPGRRYKLHARTRTADQLLSGTTLATPPNVTLLIRLKEELAAADDLPAVKPIAPPGQGKPPPPPSPPPASSPRPGDQGWSPNASPNYLSEPDRPPPSPPADPGTGARLGAPSPGGTPRPPPVARPDLTADGPAQRPGVKVEVPGPNRPQGPTNNWTPVQPPNGPTSSTNPAGAREGSRAPACSLAADQTLDFVLTDLQGQPFRLADLRGHPVLLDFWGTWSSHCIQSLPHLVDVQRRYGPRGLVVLGVAYEEGPWDRKVAKVNFVRQRQNVNFKTVLGEWDHCPVLTKLDVQNFPTLILLDADSRIVWRGEGGQGEGLSAQTRARLENELRKRLPEEP